MSIFGWINPNFWYQLRYFSPHKLNGKWFFIKREMCLPYRQMPQVERREIHLAYNPPSIAKVYSWVYFTGIWRRFMQAEYDRVVERLKMRGSYMSDYFGTGRRQIRWPVYLKNRDPYVHMLLANRNIRQRNWRTWGWQVPEKQGPGPGLGALPIRMDYHNKITRMTNDDWTDTGISTYALMMLPTVTIRKFFNEFPRVPAWYYGIQHSKEQLYNHISFGIDPGNQVIDELMNPTDPDLKAAREEDDEVTKYLYPEMWEAKKNPDYKLKWPFPDDNVYRPTYNRGSNRKYWSRNYL